MNVAITGRSNPITNQILGLRPRRFANLAVIMGRLNKKPIPILINIAAPMIIEKLPDHHSML